MHTSDGVLFWHAGSPGREIKERRKGGQVEMVAD